MVKKMKKAFTITELVIVIAVIAILAAVLIPTFSNVIENANKSAALQQCSNAMKDYQAQAVQNGEEAKMQGMVFTQNGYAYVYMNGALHYAGKVDKMLNLNGSGAFSKTPAEAKINEKMTFAGVDGNTGYTKLTVTFVGGDKTSPIDEMVLATALAGGSITLVDGSTGNKQAENMYFFDVDVNSTVYVGCFTLETDSKGSPAAYKSQDVIYSRVSVVAPAVEKDGLTVTVAK